MRERDQIPKYQNQRLHIQNIKNQECPPLGGWLDVDSLGLVDSLDLDAEADGSVAMSPFSCNAF